MGNQKTFYVTLSTMHILVTNFMTRLIQFNYIILKISPFFLRKKYFIYGFTYLY